MPIVAVLVVLAALAAGIAALALTLDGSSGSDDAELRTFVSKVENFLDQSREGRREVASTVEAAFECKLTPRQAAVRLNRVQRNRQSLLQQIAALAVPDREEALRASDLLQPAAHASITADWHYRDWLLGRTRCGPPDRSPDLRARGCGEREGDADEAGVSGGLRPARAPVPPARLGGRRVLARDLSRPSHSGSRARERRALRRFIAST